MDVCSPGWVWAHCRRCSRYASCEASVKSVDDQNVMICLLQNGFWIKVTCMHNGCWVNYYEKCSLCWLVCLTINQTNLIIMNNEFIVIRLYLEPWKVHMNLTEEAKLHCNFGCIFSPLHCVFHLPERRHSHIDCIFYFSPLCVFKCCLKSLA